VAAAAVLLLTGSAALAVAARAQQHAPQPPAAAAVEMPAGTASPTPGSPGAPVRTGAPNAPAGTGAPGAPAPVGPVLARAVPVELDIPAIGVRSALEQLGLNPDRSVQVPPLARDSHAGWYKYSPTPGQLGPSVILGHVDSAEYGPGVFFRLGALRPGDAVSVRRADRTVAVFRVERVVSYPKNQFPTLAVYGNTADAALRLITCGGRFNPSTRNYESNIVAYASLVFSHPA